MLGMLCLLVSQAWLEKKDKSKWSLDDFIPRPKQFADTEPIQTTDEMVNILMQRFGLGGGEHNGNGRIGTS